ncbi:PREDICTED: posterior protein-like [Nanorana parkeri]|uniref:posterior protein-like n=1 Tax=Nanorana parkeri TaxID=125878 RepID=UPI000854830E|nr:PREDICTED: posterior protein-like [Nanorana parkeri]
MEVVGDFLTKHASASFSTCADDALTHQFNDLLKQCDLHNDTVKTKPTSKKGKKARMANVLSMLLRMREIAEQKELQWYTEKAQLREQIENVSKNISAVVANVDSNCGECDELRDEVDQLIEQNCALEDRWNECEERCKLREQSIASIVQKESANEKVISMLREELSESRARLVQKDQDILSLKSRSMGKGYNHCCTNTCGAQERRDIMAGEEHPVYSADDPEVSPNPSTSLFTPESQRIGQRLETLRSSTNTQSTALSIQDRTNLCQILGKFDTSASPISLFNRLEAVVMQYNLGNRDACALLRAWLPLQLCEKLQPPVSIHKGLSPEINSNWGNSADRMKELQRIMGGRDTRGTNALENAKFGRGDDPVLFCNEYLSLYRATYSSPDMSPDDSIFLYSMANKCDSCRRDSV